MSCAGPQFPLQDGKLSSGSRALILMIKSNLPPIQANKPLCRHFLWDPCIWMGLTSTSVPSPSSETTPAPAPKSKVTSVNLTPFISPSAGCSSCLFNYKGSFLLSIHSAYSYWSGSATLRETKQVSEVVNIQKFLAGKEGLNKVKNCENTCLT